MPEEREMPRSDAEERAAEEHLGLEGTEVSANICTNRASAQKCSWLWALVNPFLTLLPPEAIAC